MGRKKCCAVKDCNFSKLPGDGKSIFHFPNNDNFREWLRRSGKDELLQHDSDFIKRNRYICPLHFVHEHFTNDNHNDLHSFAVPSLCLPDPLSEEQMIRFFNPDVHWFGEQTPVPVASTSSSTSSHEPSTSLQMPETEPKRGEKRSQSNDDEDEDEDADDNSKRSCVSLSPSLSWSSMQPNVSPRGEKRSRSYLEETDNEEEEPDFIDLSPPDKVPHMDYQQSLTPKRSMLKLGARNRSPSDKPPQRVSMKRLAEMAGVQTQNLSPEKKKLLKTTQEYRQMAQMVKRRLILSRRKNANLTKLINRRFIDMVDDLSISVGTRLILKGELRNFKKKKKGRSWTMEEKIFWLPHYKRSPRAFRQLTKHMCIPSETALKNLLSKIKLDPGIIEPCLNLLKERVQTMHSHEKVCVVLFNEMFLHGNLRYLLKKNFIEGFENFGIHGRTGYIADHALVFMIQGLGFQFVLPIAYYFVSKTCPVPMLKILLRDVISTLFSIGLTVVASVSDMGPTNRGAIKELKEESGDSVFYNVGNNRVAHVWDIPHIVKNVRNNLLTSDLRYDSEKVGKWRHIIDYFALDNSICKMSSLTFKHLNPKGRDKMRVCLATETLSSTTANFMESLHRASDGTKLPDCMSTVELIRNIDFFTDLTNGPRSSKKRKKPPTRLNVDRNSDEWKKNEAKTKDVTEGSVHFEEWKKMEAKLRKWTFIRKKDGSEHVPPCVKGWMENLMAFRFIWTKVKPLGIQKLRLRSLNQDALENLFCLIRQCGGSSSDLTCWQFTAALKTNLISKFATSVKGKNCLDDDSVFLRDLKHFFPVEAEERPVPAVRRETIIRGNLPPDLTPIDSNNVVHRQGAAALWSEIMPSFSSNISCGDCLKLVTTTQQTIDMTFTCLSSCNDLFPSSTLITLFLKVQALFETQWRRTLFRDNVSDILKSVCKNSVNWNILFCPQHQGGEFLDPILEKVTHFLISLKINQCNRNFKKGVLRYSRQIASGSKNVNGLYEEEEDAELHEAEASLLCDNQVHTTTSLPGPGNLRTPGRLSPQRNARSQSMQSPRTPQGRIPTIPMVTPLGRAPPTPAHQSLRPPGQTQQTARQKVYAHWGGGQAPPPPSPQTPQTGEVVIPSNQHMETLVRTNKVVSLTIPVLKAFLKKNNRRVGGKKEELCQRVHEVFACSSSAPQ